MRKENELEHTIRLKVDSIIYNLLYLVVMITIFMRLFTQNYPMSFFELMTFEILIVGRFIWDLYYRRVAVGNKDPKYAPSFLRVILFLFIGSIILVNIILWIVIGVS